ncbi:DUF2441 domain-containing protein [Ornithinibacillus sp. 4-3]|uniref:DUF2441 domain-containing protein n=1 Tax=Ornithinibacillus sp. 4-3 TaxID=3231488 RepID=A0AB39HPA0_9BACI
MEIVQERILYHINSIGNLNTYDKLKIGDIINTDVKQYNPFRASYETGHGKPEVYWRFAKEYVIEQKRIEINENLPSRWRCIWLSDEEHLPYWKTKVHNNFQIVKMKLNGKLFSGDAHWVEAQPKPFRDLSRYAEFYWDGQIFRPGKLEYLFEGKAEVIELV